MSWHVVLFAGPLAAFLLWMVADFALFQWRRWRRSDGEK